MTGSVLLASSTELHQAARSVRGLGGEAQGLARRISTTAAPVGWSGVAALARQARAQALADLVGFVEGPARQVSDAVDGCARMAGDAGTRVHRGRRLIDDARRELTRLQAIGPPPEPDQLELWRRRVEDLERQIGTARRYIAQAEDDFAAAQQRAAHALAAAWSLVQDFQQLTRLPEKVRALPGQVLGTVLRAGYGTQAAIAYARARWARTAAARVRALTRAKRALGLLQVVSEPGASIGKLRVAPGPLGLGLTWIGAVSEVRTGAGYQGWRGGVTRVTAGGALLGGPLLLGGVVHPVLPAVGVSLIGLHQAWMTGNMVWDGASTSLRYARQVAPAVRRVGEWIGRSAAIAGARAGHRLRQLRQSAEAVSRVVRTRVDQEVQEVGTRVAARTRRLVDEVITRAPERDQLRDWWRTLGEPLRWSGPAPWVPGWPILGVGS